MTMTCEIPVWVNGVEKWVTGVGRRTTCADLVRALLTTELGAEPPSEAELRAHGLVERWRQVERPLDAGARIQKVWRTWGQDTADVRFTLKRLSPLTPKEVKTPRRRHSRHRWRSSSSLEAVHPRKLAPKADAEGAARPDVVERLMQTILVQGETIAAQLRRLHEREDLIGYYEHKMHRMREDRLGSDYLLRTYLRDGEPAEAEKASHDSGVGAELTAEIEQNERSLIECERALEDKRRFVRYLEYELDEADADEQRLLADEQRMLEDERLSSLHSSSDEAAAGYVLDTLV
ncbi:ras association domain-containing protein 9-like [Pollicipes pollicipes]|uniref:ras association domain-containing protein 9-like n=1 Tax=Pollicipes pollicipes TaxID=41117 RepID=UPI00188495D2|nr:ras association domain-containing protein 9-like [Pollicipes pollicipes]